MKKLICIPLVGLLLLAGCRPKPSSEAIEGEATTIEIPETAAQSIEDIADNYHYVVLDGGDNRDALLGTISKLRVFRDKIYVLDDIFTDKLLIFDKSGKFLKKVSGMGRGPLEYIDISTFEIDMAHEEILLKEDAGGKILVFDLDGNHKRTLENPMRASGMAVLPNGNLVYGVEGYRTNDGPTAFYKLILCDGGNNVLEKYCIDETRYRFGFMSLNFMNPGQDGSVTFAPQFMNDVYRVSESGVEHIYRISSSDMLDRRELSRLDPDSYSQSPLTQKTRFVGNHADSEAYFCFSYDRDGRRHYAYYNKRSGTLAVSLDPLCANEQTFDEQGNLWGSLSEADLSRAEGDKAKEIEAAIEASGNPVVVCYTPRM